MDPEANRPPVFSVPQAAFAIFQARLGPGHGRALHCRSSHGSARLRPCQSFITPPVEWRLFLPDGGFRNSQRTRGPAPNSSAMIFSLPSARTISTPRL